MSLLDLAKFGVSRALKLGAYEAEVYLYRKRTLSSISFGGVEGSVTARIEEGIAVRTVIGKSVGFVAVTAPITKDNIVDAVKRALKIAKVKPEDPRYRHLPDPEKPKIKSAPYDEKLVTIDDSELIKVIKEGLSEAEEGTKHIERISYHVSRGVIEKAIANSRGVEDFDKGTFFTGYCTAFARKDGDYVSDSWSISSRFLKFDELRKMFPTTAKRAEELLGAKKLPEDVKTAPVVFENKVVPLLFFLILYYNLSALNVQEKRSIWKNKLNEQVASKNFTLIDDGTHPEGIYTFRTDDEGVPMQRKILIDSGILKSFIYDSYTAHFEGKKSTGNGIRQDPMNPPAIRFTNVIIKPGSKSLDDLIREVDKGIFVRTYVLGAGLIDPIRGVAAVTAKHVFFIKNGEIAFPVKPVIISFNAYESLKNIIEIGRDTTWHYGWNTPSIVFPAKIL